MGLSQSSSGSRAIKQGGSMRVNRWLRPNDNLNDLCFASHHPVAIQDSWWHAATMPMMLMTSLVLMCDVQLECT